jgi:hypothetical protein
MTGARASGPFIHPSGSEMFFGARYAGLHQIYRADVAKGAISNATVEPPLNTFGGTDFDVSLPVIGLDGLTIYFVRTLQGGGTGIFTATRASKSAPFGPPSELTALNVAKAEKPLWISPDSCRLYFERGDNKLLMASRPK